MAGRRDVAERMAGPHAQHEVGGPASGAEAGLPGERDPVGQAWVAGARAGAGQVFVVDVDADADGARRGGQDTEHQLPRPAADVEHRARVVPGQAFGQPRGPGLGQRPVKEDLTEPCRVDPRLP